jgi:hypothetical protein
MAFMPHGNLTVVNSWMMKPRSAQNEGRQRNQPSEQARQVNIQSELSLSS